jgi:Zn-dependent M28 family amino/carboxypeptidase
VEGTVPRYVVVGAHYDHLGRSGKDAYWGADDNAAAVGILVEAARQLALERDGRGCVFVAFDGEEPPFFLTEAMGSDAFVAQPPVPRNTIDFMVCMDLVGHRLGPPGLPDEVGQSLFALGAERSRGTHDLVRGVARGEPGVIVRPVDADIIPPLSDYAPFWEARIPFLFLTAGRSRVYHTPEDTVDKLDFPKIEATARWLTRMVRATRMRPDALAFDQTARDDAGTLEQVFEVLDALAPLSPEAQMARRYAETLRARLDGSGRLPSSARDQISALVGMIESRLA